MICGWQLSVVGWRYLEWLYCELRLAATKCWVWGSLVRSTGYAEASHCLFGVCKTFRNFSKAHSIGQGQTLVWISL